MQAELVVGLSLRKMIGKDILDRSNNISEVVRKESTSGSSGSFRNRQCGDVVHHVLGPCFHSVGQRFSQCVQSSSSVSQRSFRGLCQQEDGVGLGFGSDPEPQPWHDLCSLGSFT